MEARASLLLLLVSPLLFACKTTPGSPHGEDPDCSCGALETALIGCFHSLCISGEGNPDNPACVCGGLAGAGTERQYVSDGGAGTSRLIGQPQTLYLTSGKSVKGTLIADNGLLLKLRTSSGERDLRYEELAPRSVYRLEKGRTPKDDGVGLVKLGDLARKAGFWAHANRHYQEALLVDPGLEQQVDMALAALRDEASAAVLAQAQEDMQKGKTRQAEEGLATIMNEFPDEKAAVEAAAILERIDTRATAERTRSVPASDERLEKLFALAIADLEAGAGYNRKGLTNKNQSRSLGSFDNALKRVERGRKRIDSVESKNANDAAVREMASELKAQAADLYISITLNKVSVLMVRTSYNKALDAVNEALVIAPGDQRLLATRKRIETAAAESNWGFGWVRRG